MRRFAVVLVVWSALLYALADDLDPRRDANLVGLSSFCLDLAVTSTNPAVLTEWLTEKIRGDLADGAARAGFVLHVAGVCPAAEPTLRVAVAAHELVAIVRVQVVLTTDPDGFTLPVVWSESGTATGRGIDANDVRNSVDTVFEYFSQAWQRQRAP